MSESIVASSKLIATVPEFHPRYYVPETLLAEQPLLRCHDSRDMDEVSSDGSQELEGAARGLRSASVASDGSEEHGPDSGIEAEKEPDMVVPDQDTIDRIVTQVEIYFSDANVLKDKFLLKHIRRNKEGYVSLKLVSSFKKVKQLTKDWRVVAYAVSKSSTGIQINDLGTKIRRIEPLPDIDDTPVTCTILALKLPLEKPSIDTVSQLFATCGDISLIRVLRAGAPLSGDVKQLGAKYSCLGETHCAWVEFETPEAVKEACKLSSDEGMKIIPVVQDAARKNSNASRKNSQANSRKSSTNSNSSHSSNHNRENNYNYNNQNHQGHNNFYNNNFGQGQANSFLSRAPNSRKGSLKHNNNNNNPNFINGPTFYNFHPRGALGPDMVRPNNLRRKAMSLQPADRPNLRDLSVIVEGTRRPKSKSCQEYTFSSAAHPSFVHRHLFAAAVASATSAAGGSGVSTTKPITSRPGRVSLGSLTVPEGVARFPKGPDGSKGFAPRRRSGFGL